MSRTLWFVAGAASSAYALMRARRAAEAFTPEGVRDRLAGLSLGARLLGEEVRTAAAAKEGELRERLGLVPDPTPALESGPTGTGRHRATPADPPLQLTREGTT